MAVEPYSFFLTVNLMALHGMFRGLQQPCRVMFFEIGELLFYSVWLLSNGILLCPIAAQTVAKRQLAHKQTDLYKKQKGPTNYLPVYDFPSFTYLISFILNHPQQCFLLLTLSFSLRPRWLSYIMALAEGFFFFLFPLCMDWSSTSPAAVNPALKILNQFLNRHIFRDTAL